MVGWNLFIQDTQCAWGCENLQSEQFPFCQIFAFRWPEGNHNSRDASLPQRVFLPQTDRQGTETDRQTDKGQTEIDRLAERKGDTYPIRTLHPEARINRNTTTTTTPTLFVGTLSWLNCSLGCYFIESVSRQKLAGTDYPSVKTTY